jgi:hypothetical protein
LLLPPPRAPSSAGDAFNDVAAGVNHGAGKVGFTAVKGWDAATGYVYASLIERVRSSSRIRHRRGRYLTTRRPCRSRYKY